MAIPEHKNAPVVTTSLGHATGEMRDDVTLPPASREETEEGRVGSHVVAAKGAKSESSALVAFGDYELLHEVARGGMGVVYKARQRHLNRTVALKMIVGGKLASSDDVQRFYSEAEAAANLDHSGIVPIYEVGEAQGQHFFSMAFIDGQSLAMRVAEGPLPHDEAARLVLKITRAIEYAHERGIIHRDLKPANVMLDRHGEPKVTDFGLAKRMEQESGLTHTGAVLGTPSYMPPEQASGGTASVGPAADIYSLGAILYCLLTGRPPFQAANPLDTVIQVLERDPVPPRQLNAKVPRDLETISLKCLEKLPVQRYRNARELAEELERFLEGSPILARPVSWLEQGQRWCRRKPLIAGLSLSVSLLILSLAIGGPYVAWQQSRLRREVENAQRQRTYALVESLVTASPQAFPSILSGIEQEYEVALPKLRELHESPDLMPAQRARVELALMPVERGFLSSLGDYLLRAQSDEFLAFRELLAPHREVLKENYWKVAMLSDASESDRRLRAACALALYDPSSPQWSHLADNIADILCREPALIAATWVEGLRPVKGRLVQPLAKLAENPNAALAARRLQAIVILVEYRAEDMDELVRLLGRANEQQFEIVFARLRSHASAEVALTEALKQAQKETPPPPATGTSLRIANIAVALLRLGDTAAVLPLLERSASPDVRSLIVVHARRLGVEPNAFASELKQDRSSGILQAILLGLGQYDKAAIPTDEQPAIIDILQNMALSADDPGLRSAAHWALRRWGLSNDPQGRDADSARRWHVNSQGQVMVSLPRARATLGSPTSEEGRRDDELQTPFVLNYDLAVSATEITVAQFQRFLRSDPDVNHSYIRSYSPTDDCPQTSVTWHEATAYCNWLSEREGMPRDQWCYELMASAQGRRYKPTADSTVRMGYRLPTSSEWEYACRAATDSVRSHGHDPSLLPEYGWYQANALDHSWPVASKMPNDWGLFDMHGNVWEWCHDAAEVAHEEDNSDQARVLRGGSFFYHPIYIRSALRNRELSTSRFYGIGFRPVRTLNTGRE